MRLGTRTASPAAARVALMLMTQPQHQSFPNSPPMTVTKFETLQSRRVEVTVNYAGTGGWGLQARETLAVIKEAHPDVRVRRVIQSDGAGFRVLIDGKTVAASLAPDNREEHTVYLRMSRITAAIEWARRQRRRASEVYGEQSGGDSGGDSELAPGRERRKAPRKTKVVERGAGSGARGKLADDRTRLMATS